MSELLTRDKPDRDGWWRNRVGHLFEMKNGWINEWVAGFDSPFGWRQVSGNYTWANAPYTYLGPAFDPAESTKTVLDLLVHAKEAAVDEGNFAFAGHIRDLIDDGCKATGRWDEALEESGEFTKTELEDPTTWQQTFDGLDLGDTVWVAHREWPEPVRGVITPVPQSLRAAAPREQVNISAQAPHDGTHALWLSDLTKHGYYLRLDSRAQPPAIQWPEERKSAEEILREHGVAIHQHGTGAVRVSDKLCEMLVEELGLRAKA